MGATTTGTIYYQNEQQEATGLTGETILDTSLRAGINHLHACGGHALCSTCRIIVDEGTENLQPPTAEEQAMADKMGFTDQIRLACQTHINGPISIRRPVVDEVDLSIISQDVRKSQSIGSEKCITALFTDIIGFTAFTENTPPYDLVHILNRYYFMSGTVIKANKGRIIDYYGDGFLAIFGLDMDDSDQSTSQHAACAIQAGRALYEMLLSLNEYLESLKYPGFRIRAGAHSGKAIVGQVGLEGMKKFGAFGDTINLASRIEQAGKTLGTSFLVSEETGNMARQSGLDYPTGRDFEIEVKGKTGAYRVTEVLV